MIEAIRHPSVKRMDAASRAPVPRDLAGYFIHQLIYLNFQ